VFYWSALIGGLMTLAASAIALGRRIFIPEVRAMSSQLGRLSGPFWRSGFVPRTQGARGLRWRA